MNVAQRHAVIARYLAAMRTTGDVVVAASTVRDTLRDGATDLWSASELRESSAWRDTSQLDQINALLGRASANTSFSASRSRPLLRAIGAWTRSLLHSLRLPDSKALDAEVVFVEYWPTGTVVDPHQPDRWSSPYFGSLPEELCSAGTSVGFVHIHADGPATRPPHGVRQRLETLNRRGVPHRLLADEHSLGGWWSALRTWLRLVRRAPDATQIGERLNDSTDAQRLWAWWSRKYVGSVFGSHAVRTCLLSEFWRRTVEKNERTRLWIVAFEGQSWESCLARQLDAHGAKWLPYVHTMMRPWDLRAHTFLAEHTPARLAVHGNHDRAELANSGTALVDVEALRYQYLGRHLVGSPHNEAPNRNDERTWLIVGGAECDTSSRELREFLAKVDERTTGRSLVVKWHPQCAEPVADGRFTISTQPLREAFKEANAVLMVGSAAPLDAYLAGIPSCSFASPSGLSTTPINEDEYFHVATDADDAVRWLMKADARRNERPPVDHYFIIDPGLPRWRAIINLEIDN